MEGVTWVSWDRSRDELEGRFAHQYRGERQRLVIPGWEAPESWSEALWLALEQPLAPRPEVPLYMVGTVFQRAVWEALVTIPPGQLRTYGAIAAQVGRPRAVRAVGSACGANPLPFLVPCHRVVAAGGKWGGFGLGVALKQILLEREGVTPQAATNTAGHVRMGD